MDRLVLKSAYDFLQSYALTWGFLITRLTGMFVLTPLFSGMFLPTEVLVSAVLLLSFIALGTIGPAIPIDVPIPLLLVSLVNNFILGALIGSIAYLVVASVYTGTEVFGVQSGFNVSGSLDPTMEESPLTSEVVYLFALFIFISMKGHILVYKIVIQSIEKYPLFLKELPFDQLKEQYISVFWDFFLFSLQFALPIIGLMIIVNILFGLLSRLVPQMNVFMVGMPATILIMFIIFIGMIPIWAELLSELVGKMDLILTNFFTK